MRPSQAPPTETPSNEAIASSAESTPAKPARTKTVAPLRAAAYLVIGAALGAATAFVAVELQQNQRAPLFVFPIVIGLVIGAGLAAALRWLPMAHFTTACAGAVIAVAIAVVGQHYVQYRQAVATARADQAKLALAGASDAFPNVRLPPKSFFDFVRRMAIQGRPITNRFRARGVLAWSSWGLDALLALVAALVVVVPTVRQPYCDRCRSWFRTIRAGRLPRSVAVGVASAAKIVPGGTGDSADYRISHCRAGCGLARFELAWDVGSNQTAWLDAESRREVQAALDREK